MSSYILAPAAQRDLDDIGAFIAQDSVETALRILDEFELTFGKLADNIGMGRRRDELAPGQSLRSWPFYSYLILYRENNGFMEVARVLSGYRDLEKILND